MVDYVQMRLEGMKHFGFGPDVMKETKVCRVCGQTGSSKERYCSKCGTVLPKETLFDLYKTYHLYCPVCDTVVSKEALFCPECGKKLRQQHVLEGGIEKRSSIYRKLLRLCGSLNVMFQRKRKG